MWRFKGVFTIRNLTLMSMFVAMSAVLTPFSIYLRPDLKLLSFSFLPLAVGSILLGPWAALVMGFAADTLNFIIRPMPPYFPGYALSAMVANMLYAVWQYNRPLKVWRLICAHLCTVLFVYFGMNLLWQTMLWGASPAKFFTGVRFINNAVQFPFVVASIYGLTRIALHLQLRISGKLTGDSKL